MPSKDTDTVTKKETTAVEKSESVSPSSERAPPDSNDLAGIIDTSTFDQILEMDDDDEREFSRAIVQGFMEQAENTFKNMTESLEKEDLVELSSLGHFLKGSSATLGLLKVRDYCEKIQNLGSPDPAETAPGKIGDREVNLAGIKSALGDMREEYNRVRIRFQKFYDGDGVFPL